MKWSYHRIALFVVPALFAGFVYAETTVLDSVNLLTMDSDQIVENAAILVENDRIVRVMTSEEGRSVDADVRIDCDNGFLTPGLADMHVHLEHLEGPEQLVLFIAKGVTTVRAMDGRKEHLDWRAQIERGTLVGPTIFTAGPLLDGDPPIFPDNTVVSDPDEAVRLIDEQQRAGFDFAKVYVRLSSEVYEAIVSRCGELDFPFAGHVPNAVGVERVLRSGQRSIEHLDGFIEAIRLNEPADREGFEKGFYFALPMDDTKLKVLANEMRAAGVWNCPTLVIQRAALSGESWKVIEQGDRYRYVSRDKRMGWRVGLFSASRQVKLLTEDEKERCYGNRFAIVKALQDADAPILMGTDCGTPYIVPGFSAHDELSLFVDAGLMPFQAIQTATTNAAEFFNQKVEFGAIHEGARADLVLLKNNPLNDISSFSGIQGVMVRGKWYSASDLDGMLAGLAEKVGRS